VIAAERGDVAGDQTAAHRYGRFSRAHKVSVGVAGPHLQDALVGSGAVARHDGDVIAEPVGDGVDAAGV